MVKYIELSVYIEENDDKLWYSLVDILSWVTVDER